MIHTYLLYEAIAGRIIILIYRKTSNICITLKGNKIVDDSVWTITHCLGLGHETMVCSVYLSVFLCG